MVGRQRGFTLLEMLVVVALLGIATSIVLATLPGNRNESAARQSELLIEAIQLAADKAVAEGRVLGVQVSTDRWQVVELQAVDNTRQPMGKLLDEYYAQYALQWKPWQYRTLVLGQSLPEHLSLTLSMQGIAPEMPNKNDVNAAPQIWLLPGGEVTAFELTMSEYRQNSNQVSEYRIIGEESGQIRMLSPDEDR